MRAQALRIGPLVAALTLCVACGPSLRATHRSEVYFERCYAADLDERIAIEERRACWQAWMAHYQQDQTPARLAYVRERLLRLDPDRAALVAMAEGGDESDPVPVTETAPAIASEVENVTAAAAGVEPFPESNGASTTNVGASEAPPAELVVAPDRRPDIAPAVERRAARRPPIPATDAPHCAVSCRPRWDECTAQCDEGDRRACLRACRSALRICARGCY